MIAALSSLSSVPLTPSPAATPSAPHFAFPSSLPFHYRLFPALFLLALFRLLLLIILLLSRFFSIPTPQSKNLSLAKYNAEIWGLSIEYQATAEYFQNNELELSQITFSQFFDLNYDKDHQGGESVFILSVRANKMMSSS